MPDSGDSTVNRSNQRVGSLRWRVTLLIIMLSTIIQGTLCVVMVLYNRRSLDGVMDQRVRLRLGQIRQDIEELPNVPTRDDLARLEATLLRFVVVERSAITVYGTDGRVIVSSVAKPPSIAEIPFAEAIAAQRPVIEKLNENSLKWLSDEPLPGARVGVLGATMGTGVACVVSLVISDNYFSQMALAVERPAIALIAMGIIASGAAGWLVTGRLLGPLARLTQLATTLRPERLEQDEGDPVAVAELQTVQASLRETRESLREAFRAQERFLSNVAHELKTPIAVLLAEAQTIDRSALGEDGAKFVRSVDEEMKRLGKLVESFLLLAKVRAGKALLRSDVVFVNDVVMGAVEQCGLMARQYSVTLFPTLIEGELANTTVAGDPTLLQTMIDGLIRNAIKFSPHGSAVDVMSVVEGAKIVIRVRDRGPGIAPEIAETLFDRFVQAPSETLRGRGTGLGLAIAQGIAELHSGKIAFTNMPDVGCEFSIWLPVAEVTGDDETA